MLESFFFSFLCYRICEWNDEHYESCNPGHDRKT